jgi:uncharacterized membrane protein (DUF485 family)
MRSIVAVIVGSGVWGVLWVASNAALASRIQETGGRISSLPALTLLLILSFILSVVAGYVTAWLAKKEEIRHGVLLGLLQLAIGIFFTVQYYDLTPFWYNVLFLALLIPGNVLGAGIRAGYTGNQTKRQS